MLTLFSEGSASGESIIREIREVRGSMPLAAAARSFASPASSTNYLIFGLGTCSTNGLSDLDGDISRPQIWSNNLAPVDIANLYFNQVHGRPWP
jgi:hypothetical protein